MERPHSVVDSLIESKSSVDGLETKVATHPRTPLESTTSNFNSSKPNDNLKNLQENNGILERIASSKGDLINTFVSPVHDRSSLQKNVSVEMQGHEKQESSDNEDDEVNDLFRQIRKMSSRSGSQSSNITTPKGSKKDKLRGLNPFLEPFHRHSSVDMKGKVKLILKRSTKNEYETTICIRAIFYFRCNGAK